MTSLMLLAWYSATLISSLAVDRWNLHFRDLQELLHNGSYKLGVVCNTSTFNTFDVCSRYTSDYWLLQLYNLQLNGIRITRFNFRISGLCLAECIYVCMYVCMYVCVYVYMYVYMYVHCRPVKNGTHSISECSETH